MMLRNPHIRAMDRFFDSALERSFSPFAIMDKVLESVSQPIPPQNGEEFTLYKMTPVRYKVEHQKDGSVHYNIIKEDRFSEDLRGPDNEKDADKEV